MGNLCSIYYAHFDKLLALTGNHNKAVFLDKCIFWWQISKYTLDDDKIWFTRKISEISKELSISERSISRYLQEFEDKGLLEKTCRLSSSHKNNQFRVAKKLYIRITEKLLGILPTKSKANNSSSKIESESNGSFFNHNGAIDKANMATSIYKDKDHNLNNNNTVSSENNVNNFEKGRININERTRQNKLQNFPVAQEIGNHIPESHKNYIKSVLKNLQTQHALKFSDPNKLFSEIVFSVTQDLQWVGISDFHHKINIIAKLLRQNRWKTPKGFYNHWEIGQALRKKEQLNFRLMQQQKFFNNKMDISCAQKSLNTQDSSLLLKQRTNEEYRYAKMKECKNDAESQKIKNSMQDIMINISSEESYLKQLKLLFQQKNPSVTTSLIDLVATKINRLYEEKRKLEYILNKNLEAA